MEALDYAMETFMILFFMASISIMFFKYNRKGKHSGAALPPGPTPWPLVGCLPSMWRNKPTHRWIHAIMKQYNTEIACIRLGSTNVIAVNSTELALEFLKTHDSVFASRPISRTTKILSRGYLTTALSPMGDQWKKMRKLLTLQVLNQSSLDQMLRHRINEADALLHHIFYLTTHNVADSLNNLSNPRVGAVINLRNVTQHYCGNIIRRLMFNRSYYKEVREDGGPTIVEEEQVEALLTLVTNIHSFSVSDYLPCLQWFDLDGRERNVKEALKVLKKNDEPIIEGRVEEWKAGKRKEVEDLLDVFITLTDESGKSLLSIEEIKAEITEIQIAAIENPSYAAEWTMAELLNQPKILQKAIEEIDKIVGKDRLVQETDIPKLKYVTACVRESFRLHPFSPFNLPHASTSDVTIAGYLIPKGSHLLISRASIGRNPRMWEDPLRYDPERHLKDDTTEGLQEPSLRFITFARGRRGCVGSTLATHITMMLFARLLQGFSWTFMPGMTKVDFSQFDELALANPLQLVAQPRLSPSMYPTHKP